MKKRAYSQAWKYRDEIRKMHKLHEQFSLLSKYGITSITELTEARNVLDDRRKNINRKISAVRRAEKAAENLFEAVDVIKELAESENCYVRGDEFFKEEHEKYTQLISEISSQGYTVEEVINLKEYYKSQYVKLRNKLKDVRKELRIADNLIKEENEKPIRQVEDKKEEIGIDNRDRQPKK